MLNKRDKSYKGGKKMSFKRMKTLLRLVTEQGYEIETVSSFAIFARTVKL